MAVQAHLYSDHYHSNNNNNINMAFSNFPQDWGFISGSSGLEHEHQQDQKLMINSTSDHYHDLVSSSNSSKRFGMIGFQNLSSELERQRLEMDCFLHFQNEKLKAVLNEETRKREVMMMQNYESKMKVVIDAKDEVLNKATNRTKELQNYLLMVEKEAKNWEKKAIETENVVTDLNRKLNQARARRHEDAESVCNGDEGEEKRKKMVCKMCHVRSSCVLLLPCRHLCCCSACEGLLMFCPVCETIKNGSLEVYFGPN